MIVMIVEADLAPGNDSLALLREIYQVCFRCVVEQIGVERVDAHGRINTVLFLGQLNRARERAAVRIARADVEHGRHAGVDGSRNYFVSIGIVFRAVDVAMRIDKAHRFQLPIVIAGRPAARSSRLSTARSVDLIACQLCCTPCASFKTSARADMICVVGATSASSINPNSVRARAATEAAVTRPPPGAPPPPPPPQRPNPPPPAPATL